MVSIKRLFFSSLLLSLTHDCIVVVAFFPVGRQYHRRVIEGKRPNVAFSTKSRLYRSTTDDDIASMRASAIKKELESYGISTKIFLEKSELIEALKKARADGLQPKTTTSSTSSKTTSDTTTTSSSSCSSSGRPREERLREELETCQKLRASELKRELEERGISTKSFFEKSEFVKALAEARVDGVFHGKNTRQQSQDPDEDYAEYAQVEVITDDSAGPRTKGSQTPGPGGGSPFGSAGASPFGGAGGMGGISDLLKNLGGIGGMGSVGANPFGGGGVGANPFAGSMGGMGDAMSKAQELMKNPKVMELMMKAQSNPKLMEAMQECMSNPAAFAKYQNDPEVSQLINELRKYM